MAIFLRELRANFKSLIIWGVISLFLIMSGYAKYAAYAHNPDLLAILDAMPKAMLDAFNMNAYNLTTLQGFYGVMYTYFALIGGIAAAMWGSDIIAKEERDKTAEFSLVLPVTRSQVITAKTLAALVNSILLLLIIWAVNLISAQSYHPDVAYYQFVRQTMVGLFLLELIFLSIGIFLGCALKRYKRAGSTAIAILLITYFFSIISGMNEKWEFLKYLSPFKYFDPLQILQQGHYDGIDYVLTVIIVVTAMVGAYVTYNRRDLLV